jgi:hypothetical protein
VKLLPRLFKKRFVVVALAVGLVAGGGGLAFAFIGAGGTGTGKGKVQAVTFHVAIHTVSGGIVPGAATGAHLTFAVANTGTAKEHASTVTATVVTKGGDITTHGTQVPGCQSTWFSATVRKWSVDSSGILRTPPVTYTIPAGTDIHVTVNETMITLPTTPQTDCATKTPRVRLTVHK